jgi:hypothetical protein
MTSELRVFVLFEPPGIVHTLISSDAAEHRLPQQSDCAWRPFLPVRATARVSPAIVLSPSAWCLAA